MILIDSKESGKMERHAGVDSDLESVFGFSVILPLHKSNNSLQPFVHALKLAFASKGELEIVDVRADSEATEHVGVRSILEKWGLLPNASRRSDVAELGVRVKKIVKEGNKRKEIINRLRRGYHDLLVIGTESHQGWGAIFGRDLAQYLAAYFRHTTLFVPSGATSFVDPSSGKITLRTIVVPIENQSSAHISLKMLSHLLGLFPDVSPKIIGLHAGAAFPEVTSEFTQKLNWHEQLSELPPVQAIISSAKQRDVDLVVMATNGRDSFSQKIMGSNTEQVLRNISCPLLSVSL